MEAELGEKEFMDKRKKLQVLVCIASYWGELPELREEWGEARKVSFRFSRLSVFSSQLGSRLGRFRPIKKLKSLGPLRLS